MCGRFASYRDAQDLADEFAVADIADDARLLPPSWNIAPTDPVRIVVERARRDTGEIRRALRVARWGLVPSWSTDARGGARMINARAESLLDKPAFAKPLATRRCLLPADGYYEWKQVDRRNAPGSSGTRRAPAKQPYYVRPRAGSGAFAGLYEFWRDPAKAADDPDRWLVSATIVTTQAAADVAEIHDRMPVMLPSGAWDAWLDPAVGADEAARLLPRAGTELVAHEVSTAVNTATNDGPELVHPV